MNQEGPNLTNHCHVQCGWGRNLDIKASLEWTSANDKTPQVNVFFIASRHIEAGEEIK